MQDSAEVLPWNASPLGHDFTGVGLLTATMRLIRDEWSVIWAVVSFRLMDSLVETWLQAQLPQIPNDPAKMLLAVVALATNLSLWSLVVWWLFAVTLLSFLDPATFFAIAFKKEHGRKPATLLVWKRAVHKWMPYTTTGLVVSVAILGGSLLLIVPGLMILTRTFLFGPVIVLEPRTGVEACRDSMRMMGKTQRRALVVAIELLLLAYIIIMAASHYVVKGLLPDNILTLITSMLVSSLWCVFYLLPMPLYLALRVPSGRDPSFVSGLRSATIV